MVSEFHLKSHALIKRSFVGMAFHFLLCVLFLTTFLFGSKVSADEPYNVDSSESLGIVEQISDIDVPEIAVNNIRDVNLIYGLEYLDIQDTDKTGIFTVNTPADLSDHYCVTTQKDGCERYVYKFYADEYPTFTLLDGPGTYEINFFSHVQDTATKYVRKETAYVTLSEDGIGMNAYLVATYMIPISEKEKQLALSLTNDVENRSDKIKAIQQYVADEFYYDYIKAYTIPRGYRCKPDVILEEKNSICTDYATVMTGMLRSLGIPSCMVWGWADGQYHAWVEAELDGYWMRYDPTMFDSDHHVYPKNVETMEYVSTRRY